MVTINNFEVMADRKIAISVKTDIGQTIERITIWSMYDYKDYNKAVDISSKLLKINNTESIILDKNEFPINTTTELLFMEVQSSEEGCNGANAVTYNLSNFRKCLLDYIFKEYDVDSNCISCGDSPKSQMSVTVSLMMDSVEKSLELGMYGQAIDLIEKLRKLCKSENCGCSEKVISSCNTFKQF